MTHADNGKKIAVRKAPTNALYRSRIEICKILHVLAREACPIFAEIGDESLFVTRILLVDEHVGFLAIEYGTDKSINSTLFNLPALRFKANYSGAHLVFKVAKQMDMLLDNKPAIRFALPRSLIWSNHRELPRVVVPPNQALSCIYKDTDGEIFKAKIVDISLDGMGGMVSGEGINLKVGTVLKGCRIIYPGGEPVTVDLVVRNTKTVASSDGTFYTRSGVRFIQSPEEIKGLINFFIHNLDRTAS